MELFVTPTIAAILTFLYIALAVSVIRTRGSEGVGVGHGESKLLERRIRAHGNFAEYVPIALILILLLELTGAQSTLLWGLGAALIVGRAAHAFALSSLTLRPKARVGGMILTLGTLISAAATLLLRTLGL